MPTLKFFVSLFLSCVFVFVQISPGKLRTSRYIYIRINIYLIGLGLGLGNMCFDCSKWLSNCQIEKGLLVAFAEEDNSILVDAGPDESPDSALENCLLPGKKITGNFALVYSIAFRAMYYSVCIIVFQAALYQLFVPLPNLAPVV